MRTLPPAPAALPRPHPFLSPPSKPPPPDPALRRGVRFSPSSASKPTDPGSRFSLTACFSAPHCHKALLMHDPSPPPLQTPQTPPKCVPLRPPCPYPAPTACHRLIIHLSGTLSPSPGNPFHLLPGQSSSPLLTVPQENHGLVLVPPSSPVFPSRSLSAHGLYLPPSACPVLAEPPVRSRTLGSGFGSAIRIFLS